MGAPTFDVVIVPDFSPLRAHVFEARTLFFLASWLENAGRARSYHLQVVCIGQPPQSVRWLAERCRAEITVRPPLRAEARGTSNKLRGLEIAGQTDQVLLLDADMLILSDPSDLVQLGACLAAAPEDVPKIPERDWRRIYAALNLPLPTERIASLCGELGNFPLANPRYPEQNDEVTAMLPYYNAGVVYSPWRCGLRSIWEEHIRSIAALFDRRADIWAAVGRSDQAGLATALQSLQNQGIPFVRLPDVYHTRGLHLQRRALALDQIKIFHAYSAFSYGSLLGANSKSRLIYKTFYRLLWLNDRRLRRQTLMLRLLSAAKKIYPLGPVWDDLYQCYVAEALRQ